MFEVNNKERYKQTHEREVFIAYIANSKTAFSNGART